VMHSDRSQAQRDAIVGRFRTGATWVLIATDLMARGMDFAGVNCVLNYDFPQSTVSYIHRIGRTGRAGRAGRAVTFFTHDDVPMLRSVANVMRLSGCDVPPWMLALKKMGRSALRARKKRAPRRRGIRTDTAFDRRKAQRRRMMVKSTQQGNGKGKGSKGKGKGKAGGGANGGPAGRQRQQHQQHQQRQRQRRKKKKRRAED